MALRVEPDGNHVSAPISLTEPFLTIAEVAEIFGVGTRTIRTRIREGQLKAVRVGAQIRIEPAELRRYITDSTEPAQGGDAA